MHYFVEYAQSEENLLAGKASMGKVWPVNTNIPRHIIL